MSGVGTKWGHALGEAEPGTVSGLGQPDMTALGSSSQENTMSESRHTAVPLTVHNTWSPGLLVGTFFPWVGTESGDQMFLLRTDLVKGAY